MKLAKLPETDLGHIGSMHRELCQSTDVRITPPKSQSVVNCGNSQDYIKPCITSWAEIILGPTLVLKTLYIKLLVNSNKYLYKS